MDVIGVKLAGRYDFFDFGDRCIRSRGHVRIEIASCLAKHEIPLRVCSPCLDNCEIGSQPPPAKISHPVDLLRHLSRSAARRVRKKIVRTCKSRWWTDK